MYTLQYQLMELDCNQISTENIVRYIQMKYTTIFSIGNYIINRVLNILELSPAIRLDQHTFNPKQHFVSPRPTVPPIPTLFSFCHDALPRLGVHWSAPRLVTVVIFLTPFNAVLGSKSVHLFNHVGHFRHL